MTNYSLMFVITSRAGATALRDALKQYIDSNSCTSQEELDEAWSLMAQLAQKMVEENRRVKR